jgi:hypothetical protein
VTGASSGIGAATAALLGRAGIRLFLAARRADRLEEVSASIRAAGGEAVPIAADLTLPEERVRLFRHVAAAGGADILIHSAGLGWYGYYAEMPWETALEMIQVNIAATAHLTSLFLPAMEARGRGHIVGVGSIAGGIPSQGVALYSASKAFLDAFTTSLCRELRGTPIRVSVIRPGPVATEFFDAAASRSLGARLPAERLGIRPERVARAVLSVLRRPRRAVYVPWTLGIVPWVEACFGWLMDLVGPLHLRARSARP